MQTKDCKPKSINIKAASGIKTLLMFSFFSIMLYAYFSGITGHTLKNGSGCTCYGLNPSRRPELKEIAGT